MPKDEPNPSTAKTLQYEFCWKTANLATLALEKVIDKGLCKKNLHITFKQTHIWVATSLA